MASGDVALDAKIAEWLQLDKNPNTIAEIEGLQRESKWDELRSRLMTRLAFGTAGLRGVMRAGYNGMNEMVVIQTAQGLMKYVKQCYPDAKDQQRGVVFGFDGRYQSKRFAELSAGIFLQANIPVYLYGKTVATPMVPFAVMEKQCLAGVMVTASHNPKEDNGYKVYWTNGAQIISPHDKNIQSSILDNLTPFEGSWAEIGHYEGPVAKLINPFDEMEQLYMEKLAKNIPARFRETFNTKSNLEFVYSAMHGVGYPFVERGFEVANLRPLVAVPEQQFPDPEFPTVKYPNPEEGKSSLELSTKLATERNLTLILANDPDADRLACAENVPGIGWKVYTGNELGALLGWWAIQYYKEEKGSCMEKCCMLSSTVSSKILRSMAKKEGFHFEETLTGFKWMGNRAVELMRDEKEVLFAFEEAIGFMFSPVVLDKDGVSAAVHLATMACYLKETEQKNLYDKLQEIYQEYGIHCSVVSYFLCYDPELIERMFERIRNWGGEQGKYPKEIGQHKIKFCRDLTVGTDTEQPDGVAVLPSSKSSQMITLTFENGVIITLRTSGTEPKIKYYSEIVAEPGNSDLAAIKATLDETVAQTVELLLEPTKNGLIPKSD